MAARVKLTCAAGGTSASVTYHLARPPFLFVADSPTSAAWTGTVDVEMSMLTPPQPNNGGGVTNDGTVDASVDDWMVIINDMAPGTQANWDEGLYHIRLNGANVATGTCKVYVLEQVFNPDTASGE